jgi:rhodanese-related sulfurtransferase
MYENLDNTQFSNLAKKPGAIILDVRTPKEVSEGFIPGAIFIDVNDPTFEKQLEKLDKEKTYLVYCRSGARSAKACRIMATRGFKIPLYNLAMGITSWNGELKQEKVSIK